jgi:penicillin-binding protein 1A
MKEATAKIPIKDFARPRGIVTATVSTRDGGLITDPKNKESVTDFFIDGTQPKHSSTAPVPVDPKASPAVKTNTAIPGQSGKTTTPSQPGPTSPGGAPGGFRGTPVKPPGY